MYSFVPGPFPLVVIRFWILCAYLKAPPLPPTSFFAYWFPSYMAFRTVLEGFQKYGGWREACTLPIDARTCILGDSNLFYVIFIDFRMIWRLGRVGDARTLPMDARTCLFIDFRLFSFVFHWFQEDLKLSGPESWPPCGNLLAPVADLSYPF